jgi:hypothetical protein
VKGYTAYVFCVEKRHRGKLMDIEQMKIGNRGKISQTGEGKKYDLGEDRLIRTVNKNMKCPFKGHLTQPNTKEEK